jgi:hypothetical protein
MTRNCPQLRAIREKRARLPAKRPKGVCKSIFSLGGGWTAFDQPPMLNLAQIFEMNDGNWNDRVMECWGRKGKPYSDFPVLNTESGRPTILKTRNTQPATRITRLASASYSTTTNSPTQTDTKRHKQSKCHPKADLRPKCRRVEIGVAFAGFLVMIEIPWFGT